MSALEPLIADLALILVCAGVMTLIFKRLRQPLVLGYIVAGFLASPGMPYMPSVTDLEGVHLWSDLGVIFLLFALGLEFSFKKIVRMGSAPIIAACCIIVGMMAVGFTTGSMFGWGRMDSIFLGGMLAMSSTTIIFKAFDDMGIRQQHFAGMVLGVLIIEDILAIVLMVVLSTLAVSQQVAGLQLAGSIARLVFFLVLWFVVGIYVIPLFLRKVRMLMSPETMLIVSLGLCFAMVVAAAKVGFSPAFGAFIMGSILAETIEAEQIEHVVAPVKDLFGAIFFVSVGMMVRIELIVEYAVPIVCIIAAIMAGHIVLSTCSFLLAGQPLKRAMQCSFSLTQIGEFAFILATLGTSLGVTSDFLYPIVVAVSVFTTFTTPYMIRLAVPAYEHLYPHLPASWRTWLESHTGNDPAGVNNEGYWRQYLAGVGRQVLIYGVLCIAIMVAMFMLAREPLGTLLPAPWDGIAMAGITLLLMSPFLRALMLRQSGTRATLRQLWDGDRSNRAPLVAVQLLRIAFGAALVGNVLANTVHWGGAVGLCIVLVAVGVILSARSLAHPTGRLEKTFTDNLLQRERAAAAKATGEATAGKQPQYAGRLVERDVHIADFSVPVGIAWAGQTLARLNLGRRFGVHVVAVARGHERINIPSGNTIILPADRLQVIGSDAQLAAFAHELEMQTAAAAKPVAQQSEMKLRRVGIEAGSTLAGKTLRDSGIRQDYHCLVVGKENGHDDALLAPNPVEPLKVGDVLWVVGEDDALQSLEQATRGTSYSTSGATTY